MITNRFGGLIRSVHRTGLSNLRPALPRLNRMPRLQSTIRPLLIQPAVKFHTTPAPIKAAVVTGSGVDSDPAATGGESYFVEREAKTEADKSLILHFTSDLSHQRGKTMEAFRIFYRVPKPSDSAGGSPDRAAHTPAQGWVRMIYPFSTDTNLRSLYTLFETDHLRTGKILEDLDAFAADVAYRHCGVIRYSSTNGGKIGSAATAVPGADAVSARQELTIVTASLDRVTFVERLSNAKDLKVEGIVTWVGSSSMEVRVDLWSTLPAAGAGGAEEYLGSAHFIMVARDPKLSRGVIVNALQPITKREKMLFDEGESNRRRRMSARELSLQKKPPTIEEAGLIHNMYIARKKHEQNNTAGSGSGGTTAAAAAAALGASPSVDTIPMEKTKISETSAMQYQDRNIHNKIFGGHLMRLAYQLAWVNVYKVTGLAPLPRLVDDIRFVHPVSIGDVMTFNSQIVYTDPDTGLALVHVDAVVEDPMTRSAKTTNEFYFGFTCTERASSLSRSSSNPPAAAAAAAASAPSRPLRVPFVMPQSYDEAMMFLDGRRRATPINTKS